MPPDSAPQPESSSHDKILTVVLVYAVFAGLWILLSDKLVEILFSNPEHIILASIFKGWLFVGVTSLLLWALMRRWVGGDTSANAKPAVLRRLGLPFILLAMVIINFTCIAIIDIFIQHKGTEFARLQAIANLKTQQVSDWLKERHGDAEFLQTSDVFADQYLRWQIMGDLQSGGHLQERLEQFRQSQGYGAITLLSPKGEKLWGSGESQPDIAPPLQAAAESAIKERKARFVGPYRGVQDTVRMDIVVPLTVPPNPAPLVVLHINLADWLFPTLQSWPVPSASGETVLFRRDGDQVLFLNELRRQKDTAAKLHLPIATEKLLSAQVLRGAAPPDEPIEGVDYRGIPAIGVAHAIAGTDWLLLAKLDQAELYDEIVVETAWIACVGLLLLFMSGSGFYLYRQHQQLRYANTVQQAQAGRLRALNLLAAIADSSEDAIYAKDLEGCYTLINTAACHFVGKSPEEVLGNDDRAIFPAGQAELLMAIDQRVIAQDQIHTQEEVLDTVDGERVFLATKGPLRNGQSEAIGIFGVARDITERKRAEAALVASESEYRSLFENMMNGYAHCQMLYKNGGAHDFVFLKVNKAFETLTGLKDVVGYKACDIMPCIRETDPDLLATFNKVAQDGQALQFETYVNALQMWFLVSVYSPQYSQFVTLFDVITERKQAEEALKKLTEDMSATLQAIPDLLFEMDETGRYIKVKTTQEELLAAPTPHLLGHTVQEILPADAARTVMEAMAAARLTGSDYGRTINLRLADGEHCFELSVARKSAVTGQLQHFVVVSRDITERKAAEAALRQQARELSENNAELLRFNHAMIGRELDMIGLKKQVNALCLRLGQEPPYPMEFLDAEPTQNPEEKLP